MGNEVPAREATGRWKEQQRGFGCLVVGSKFKEACDISYIIRYNIGAVASVRTGVASGRVHGMDTGQQTCDLEGLTADREVHVLVLGGVQGPACFRILRPSPEY